MRKIVAFLTWIIAMCIIVAIIFSDSDIPKIFAFIFGLVWGSAWTFIARTFEDKKQKFNTWLIETVDGKYYRLFFEEGRRCTSPVAALKAGVTARVLETTGIKSDTEGHLRAIAILSEEEVFPRKDPQKEGFAILSLENSKGKTVLLWGDIRNIWGVE